jgi:hypothetical protein
MKLKTPLVTRYYARELTFFNGLGLIYFLVISRLDLDWYIIDSIQAQV